MVTMMDEIKAERITLKLTLTVYNEELKDSNPSELPLSQLPDQIARAKSMKDEILLNFSEFSETQISSQLKAGCCQG